MGNSNSAPAEAKVPTPANDEDVSETANVENEEDSSEEEEAGKEDGPDTVNVALAQRAFLALMSRPEIFQLLLRAFSVPPEQQGALLEPVNIEHEVEMTYERMKEDILKAREAAIARLEAAEAEVSAMKEAGERDIVVAAAVAEQKSAEVAVRWQNVRLEQLDADICAHRAREAMDAEEAGI